LQFRKVTMKKFLLASAAVAALATGAQAADLGVPREPVASAIVSPVFNWTGFYLGAHIGYGWGKSDWNFVGAGTFVSPNTNGVFGGLQIGYNYQINNFVLGLEADASAADLSGWRSCPNAAFTCHSRANFLGTVRGRIGYAFDRALVYGTAGLAIGNYRHRDFDAATLVQFGSYSTTRAGLAVGAGVEYAFAPNWTAKLEYMYSHFGSSTQLAGAGSLGGADDVRIRNQIHTV
jgi:outer membrane immunogenic protein